GGSTSRASSRSTRTRSSSRSWRTAPLARLPRPSRGSDFSPSPDRERRRQRRGADEHVAQPLHAPRSKLAARVLARGLDEGQELGVDRLLLSAEEASDASPDGARLLLDADPDRPRLDLEEDLGERRAAEPAIAPLPEGDVRL